ncbi:MAG: GIY-YIG nuclease family protein, partial [Candidatus Levybacteria bacterium]|nr:GIY-YIG nuclease family protein [Candidatus Levybacteria bacterium]
MFYTYILHSKKDGKLYIGYTPDLKRRIELH